jgi:hypothetical protein
LFYLMNEPVAAEVEQVWGRSASSGLATGPTGASLTALFATPRARGGGAESGPSFGCFGPGRPPPISIWLDRGRRALTGGVFEADRPHTCSTSAATGEFIKKNNRRPARRSAKIHRTAANG